MAKSLRSKAKRDHRAKKRTDGAGVYAATEAARLHRLNAKLKKLISNEEETIQEQEDIPASEAVPASSTEESMEVDPPKRISTHGPRGSRREEWRLSKGLNARPTSRGMNRQGGIAAARNSGRPKRRR